MKVLNENFLNQILNNNNFKEKLSENIDFAEKILDFSLQKKKMINVLGWNEDVIEDIEKLYIKFIALNKTLNDFKIDFKIIPNRFIDEFWHTHILDTQKYMDDCNKYFGFYFHHFPYYGMRNEEDLQDWFDNAQICQEIWENLFGEKLYGELNIETDSYSIDKEFYKKLSQLYKDKKELWAMGCSKCRTCRPSNCP